MLFINLLLTYYIYISIKVTKFIKNTINHPIDSNGKKTRFQNQVKIELGLKNLDIIRGRAEDCKHSSFEAVISRAFASLTDMLKLTDHLCAEKGVFLAMKALNSEHEISQLPVGYALIANHALTVPGCEGTRHLMEIRRV